MEIENTGREFEILSSEIEERLVKLKENFKNMAERK